MKQRKKTSENRNFLFLILPAVQWTESAKERIAEFHRPSQGKQGSFN